MLGSMRGLAGIVVIGCLACLALGASFASTASAAVGQPGFALGGEAVTFSTNPEYTLTVSRTGSGAGSVESSPEGIECGSTCVHEFEEGEFVTLTATPDPGSVFVGWSGEGCAGAGQCSLSIFQDAAVTAEFLELKTLTVSLTGSGAGSVYSSPGGIECGAICSYEYEEGAQVTLTAYPESGSVFKGWSGAGCSGTDPCTVTLSAARSVSAEFVAQHFLSVVLAGTGAGHVGSSPVGIDCGFYCIEAFDENTRVTLTATPESGSTFSGWSGGGCSGTAKCVVTLAAETAVTATFDEIPLPRHALTVTRAGTGAGSVYSYPDGIECGTTCSGEFVDGTEVTLSAYSEPSSTFAGWSGGGCSGTGSCTVSIDGDQAVQAVFNVEPRSGFEEHRQETRPTVIAHLSLGAFVTSNDGTAAIGAAVSGSGTISVAGKGVKPISVRVARAGTVSLTITPNAKAMKALKKKGKANVSFTVTFTPTVGDPVSQPVSGTLRLSKTVHHQTTTPPPVSGGNGTIVVEGANEESHLRVSRNGNSIQIHGHFSSQVGCALTSGHNTLTCPTGGVHELEFNMGPYDDKVEIDSPLPFPVLARLGSGSDKFIGNDEADTCYSEGSKRNRCIGGGGNDTCITGNQNSDCVGGPGDDYCKHGAGSDGCFGGPGDDECVMGAGKDGCHGGPGNDRLFGGPDPDQLYGGGGNDYCDGGPGVGRSHQCESGPGG